MKFICGPWGEGAASWNHCSLNKKGNIHYTVNRIIWTKEQWMHIRFAGLPLQFYSTTHPAQKMVVFSWYCAHDNTCCNHTLLRQSNTYYILHYILLYICIIWIFAYLFQCNPGVGLKSLFDMVHRRPKKVILFGGACSNVTDQIVKAARHWHLVQVYVQ